MEDNSLSCIMSPLRCRLPLAITVKLCRWLPLFNRYPLVNMVIPPSSIMIDLIITIEIEGMISILEEVVTIVTLVTIIGTEIPGIAETEEMIVVDATTARIEGAVGG